MARIAPPPPPPPLPPPHVSSAHAKRERAGPETRTLELPRTRSARGGVVLRDSAGGEGQLRRQKLWDGAPQEGVKRVSSGNQRDDVEKAPFRVARRLHLAGRK